MQINVYTPAQAEVIKSMLPKHGFNNIIHEDWTTASDTRPSQIIFVETDITACDCEPVLSIISNLFDGFFFEREIAEDETVIFSCSPTAKAGKLTTKEFLDLFPEEYRKDLIEAEVDTFVTQQSVISRYGLSINSSIDLDVLSEWSKADPSLSQYLSGEFRKHLLDLEGNPLEENRRYTVDGAEIFIERISLRSTSIENLKNLFFAIECEDKTICVQPTTLSTGDNIPTYQTQFKAQN